VPIHGWESRTTDVASIVGRVPQVQNPERSRHYRARSTRERRIVARAGTVPGGAFLPRACIRPMLTGASISRRPRLVDAVVSLPEPRPDGAARASRRHHGRLPGRTAATPFAEIKTRIPLAVIGDLGPQLYNVNMDPAELARPRCSATSRRSSRARRGSPRDDRSRIEGDIADAHSRPWPARATALGRLGHGDHGQRRPNSDLGRASGPAG